MSFNFEWDKLSKEFTEEIKLKLTSALNSKKLPAVIADVIEIQELNLGTKAPELEILEIGDLTEDRFRGIFKLTYSGDAHIVLKTKVQVNPVQVKSEHSLFTSRGMVMAHTPLVIPMLLKISDLNLRGIVVLSISKRHGITLVFKNDPLQSVQVGSSFDTFKIVQDLLQVQIENQIRNLFQEHIPAMVHNFSHLVTKNNSTTPSSNSSTAVNTPLPQSPTKKKGWESPTKDYMDYKNNNNTYYTSFNDHPALKDRAHLTNSNFPFHPLSTRPGFPFMRVRSSSQSSSASDELHPSAFLPHLRPHTANVYTKQNPPSAISKLGRIPQNKENRGEDLGFKFALTP